MLVDGRKAVGYLAKMIKDGERAGEGFK